MKPAWWEMRNLYKILVRKPGGKRSHWRPGRRWEDNIPMDLKEIKWEFVDSIYLARNMDQWRALVNTVMNL